MADDDHDLRRITLGAGRELQDVGDKPDLETQVEEKTVQLSKAQAELAGLRQDIKERKKYARRIFKLICFWVSGLFLLIVLEGFGTWRLVRFSLPQPVLLAVIGSTTLNVLGLFYIVAHYLFPDRGHHTRRSDGDQSHK